MTLSTADQVLSALAHLRLRDKGNGRYICDSPLRPGSDSLAFSLFISGPEHGGYLDRISGAKGGLYELAAHLGIATPRRDSTKRTLVQTYPYTDAAGTLLYEACRYEPGRDGKPKDFNQRVPDGQGGYRYAMAGVALVLYRLPAVLAAVAAGETVYIVEGEKDVHTLALYERTATTNVAGAGKWRPEYAEALRGATVVILPDNDAPGAAHADAVAQALAGVAASVKVVSLPGLQPKGDVTDWTNLGHTMAELDDLVVTTPAYAPDAPALAAGATAVTPAQAEAEDDAPEPWEPPLPLGRATEALPAFPTEALPSWLRAYVEALAAATQTPADMAATLALAVVATTCQRRTRVCVRPGWVEPTNLYTLVAMPPANRKSAVFAALVKPIDDYEREQRAIAEPIIKGAESESRILENRLKSAEKDASGRGVEATIAQEQARELAAELAAFRVPALPRFIVGDVTPEKLASLICEQGGRMALLDDEGGFFDILAGRYSSGQPNLECVLKGHAGTSPLRVDRGTRPSEFVESPALTLGLAVQPAVLDGLAATASFRGRGLLGRFLYAVPLSPVGTRVFDAPAVPAQVDAAYHRHVTALLARPTGLDERGTSAPDTLHLTPAALAALKTMDGWLEPQLAEGAELGSLADWAGKLLGAVARIAGLVHMAEHGPAGIAQPISGPTMDAAVAIGHYYLAHAQAAFGLIGADAGAELARKVWRWIEARGVMAVSRSDIWQGLRKGSALSTVDDLEAPLGLLVRHGYLRLAPAAPVTGRGRKPTPVYEVNPLPSPNNPNNPNRTGHGATFAPVPPMIAATDRIDRIDRTPPSTSTTPIAPDAVAAGLAALALAEAHLARHAAALTDEVDTVDTDEAPEARTTALPDCVAEAELTDGSTVWLVLDAAEHELSRHTTEAAAHEAAAAALRGQQ